MDQYNELPKTYAPSEFEDRIYQNWCDKGYFTPDVKNDAEHFSVVIPPPNVTGQLHMGHALDETLQDILVRTKRMQGYARYDGTPLLDHDVAVAEIATREIGLGRNSTVAAILHDVLRIANKEQPEMVDPISREIRERFGEPVLGIIVGLCKISNIKLKVSKEQANDFRDMIVSYSEDPRVILIKLADRLEVMRELQIFPPEKRRKKSWESMNLYAQIAHKLGLYALKSELEDLALKWLEPKDYEYICRRLEETESERQTFIARFLVPIEEKLKAVPGLSYHIKGRTKSVYSI